MAQAVWKNKDVEISTNTPIEYEVILTDDDGAYDEGIYKGVATPKPNTDKVKIRINDFAKNVVNSDTDYLFSYYNVRNLNNYCKGVGVQYNDNGTWTVDSDMYTNNYDYNNPDEVDNDYLDLPDIVSISNPITKFSNRGYVLFTVFNKSNSELLVEITEPNSSSFYVDFDLEGYKAAVFQYKNLPVGKYVIYGDDDYASFEVVERCNRYNLHYINAKGGYDTLPIEGMKDRRIDNFEYSYYKKKGHNQNYQDYQMNKFQTNITPKWELQTGFLTDEQSKKMYNLFGSQKVWLEDTEEDRIYPVYITDKNVTYKTFTNNGKKKISYSINVTSANTLVKL